VYGFAPVQGATDVMYWAAHLSNDRIVIYKWIESEPASKVIRVERAIPACTPSNLGYSCLTADNDWCQGADDRISILFSNSFSCITKQCEATFTISPPVPLKIVKYY
jgi:hypothetical protein